MTDALQRCRRLELHGNRAPTALTGERTGRSATDYRSADVQPEDTKQGSDL
jgi:hypothetical protein